ncbi:MAG: hypothetical protein ACPG4T_18825 [Nannocystaceae bacterium]
MAPFCLLIHVAPRPAKAAPAEQHGETHIEAPEALQAPEAATPVPTKHVHHAGDGCTHGGHHKAHTWSLIGARFAVITVVGPPGSRADGGRLVSVHPGITASYELQVIPNWLEIELAAGVLAYPEGALFPIDLLFKKPFHIHHKFTPYIAVGPSLEVILAASREVLPGVGGRVGAYIWLTKHFGFDIEAGYNSVFEPVGVAHDIIGEIGPVVHF